MRRKQTEEDVLWETFLIRKQEQEGKRRKVAEEVLAPAAKKARVVETENEHTYQTDAAELPKVGQPEQLELPEVGQPQQLRKEKVSLNVILNVKGSKKAGGSPIMSVKSMTEHFSKENPPKYTPKKMVSKTFGNLPKLNLMKKSQGDTPKGAGRPPPNFKSIKSFWDAQSGNMEKITRGEGR